MDSNQIISDWRGECRHEGDTLIAWSLPVALWRWCGKCGKIWGANEPVNLIPDYSDPMAWDEDLYAEIEEKKLNNMFVSFLNESMPGTCPSVHQTLSTKTLAWHYTKATPTQKACALARTINNI